MVEVGFVEGYRHVRARWYADWLRFVEGRPTLVRVAAAVAMAAVTAACAQVRLYTPLSPVPYTGQVFAVLLTGGLLGARWGAASQTLYVLLGVAGLPVFAGAGAGWGVVAGITGGYLLAFPLAAAFVGHIVHRPGLAPHRPLLVGAPLGLAALAALAAIDLAFLARRASHLATLGVADYSTRDALVTLVEIAGVLAAAGALVAVSLARREHRDRLEAFLAMVVGILIVYAIGAAVFWAVVAADPGYARVAPATFSKVVELTLVPFVPADLAKAALAVGVLSLVLPRRAERLAAGAGPAHV